jgi:hypothetical protein
MLNNPNESESLPPAPVKPDPWEEKMALIASNNAMMLDEPKPEAASSLSAKEWYPINTLRNFFSGRVILGYEKRLPKDEILHMMEEKRMFERILTAFLGGEQQMQAAQDQFIRSLERNNHYVIRGLHTQIVSVPQLGDFKLNYERLDPKESGYEFL